MKEYRDRGGKAPRIVDPGIGGKWSFSRSGRFTTWKEIPVPIV
jgi:hypothetical protein